eukprot:1141549-Pelagomonas_calceolata.AAC.10
MRAASLLARTLARSAGSAAEGVQQQVWCTACVLENAFTCGQTGGAEKACTRVREARNTMKPGHELGSRLRHRQQAWLVAQCLFLEQEEWKGTALSTWIPGKSGLDVLCALVCRDSRGCPSTRGSTHRAIANPVWLHALGPARSSLPSPKNQFAPALPTTGALRGLLFSCRDHHRSWC